MRVITAFWMALSMFTAVPLPYRPWRDDAVPLLLCWFPAVGCVVGALWALAAWVCARVSLPAPLTAAVIAAAPLLLTGFFHLDGFLDTSDAVLSRRDREERLRILKDSHVGAFAVISLGLLLMLQFAGALTMAQKTISPRLLLVIPAASRAAAALAMTVCRPLSHSQYSGRTIPKGRAALLVCELLLVLAGSFLLAGWRGLAVAAFAMLVYAGKLGYAAHDLGGVSGDLSGYALTAAECGALLCASILC